MATNLLKSVLHNLGVVVVALALAYLGTSIDSWLGIPGFSSPVFAASGILLLTLGFLLRLWAVADRCDSDSGCFLSLCPIANREGAERFD